MAIKALIFDIGGVLVQRVNRGRRKFWEARLGISADQIPVEVWLSPIGRLALIGRASHEDVWREIGRKFLLTSAELSQLEFDFQDESILDEPLLDFIHSLRPAYKIGVISDAFLDARSRVTALISTDCFDSLVFSAEEGITKPDPVIFTRALDRLGVTAPEAIFVDDMPLNVASAQKLGLHAVQFHNSAQARLEITKIIESEKPLTE
jgi:epoxide hydrolase-like predicted phosphatase